MSDSDIYDAPTDLWIRPTEAKEQRQRRQPATVPNETLWDVHRAAAFLSMSKHWVYKAAAAGILPYRKIGSALRFVPAEIKAWADATKRST